MMPLHISLKAANTRMVNLLLIYMTKIRYTAIKQIRKILKELIPYKAFANYMSHASFQTKQMKLKQILMLKKNNIGESTEKSGIVRCSENSSSYLDE